MKNPCRIVWLIVLLPLVGCTTALQVTAKNDTDQQLKLAVAVEDGKEPAKKLSDTVASNGTFPKQIVGKFKVGSPVVVTLSLPQGGIVADTERILPSKPDPFPIELTASKIEAATFDPADASTIERQITNIDNSCLSPSANIDSLLGSGMGGVFLLTADASDSCKYNMLFDPTLLKSRVSYDQLYPGAHEPKYSLVLTTNEASSANLKAQVPQTIELKTDFSASKLYKYEFTMRNTTWAMTPKSWASVQLKLMKTDEGKKILADLVKRIAGGEKLGYLDQAYFMGDTKVEVYSAKALNANMHVAKDNVLDGGIAYKWMKSEADTKHYENLVLRVRYAPLKLMDIPPSPAAVVPQTAPIIIAESYPIELDKTLTSMPPKN